MTAVETRPAPAPTDLRHASRLLAALLLPIGPAAVAILRFILPYMTADDSRTVVRLVAEHQAAANAVVWLGFVASMTMTPAVIFAGRAVGRSAPRLVAVATPLLVVGYLSLAWLVATDAAVLFAVRHDIPAETAATMYEGFHPVIYVAGGLFVVGHVLGTILLGIGMLRGRMVPAWAAWATIVAQPIHFVAAVILGSHWLDLVGWGLNAVGFAALSIAILRLPDDEWAPAPPGTL
jgi:hypothetical protein